MPLTPVIDMAKMEKYTDTPKFGTVIDNNDPDMLGKIKVTIPGIMEGPATDLPWVRRKNDTSFCGDDAEMFDVPSIGSVVEVRWNYDEKTPMYSGAPNSKKHTSKVFTNNYPYEGGIRFGKCYIKFDKASSLITISNGKAFIQLDPMGNISMTTQGNTDITSTRDINLNSANVNISGNLKVKGTMYSEKGANGAITPITIGTVAGGIVTGIM